MQPKLPLYDTYIMASTYRRSVQHPPKRGQAHRPHQKNASSRAPYRPEIDGLRAFAVVAVIIYHFNSAWLPSGFLGVDVFFVISGFVVTSSLTGKPDQSWSQYLLNFYARRVKRLIPALVFCVVLTSLIGCLFIDADLTKGSLRTGIASLFGLSNIYILRQRTDYFGQSADLNLFTQTWSLGVEEQFYLFFPILLGLCGYTQRKRLNGAKNLFWAILCLSTLSLIGYLALSIDDPDAAFFLMPARFWEVGAGALMFLSRNRIQAAMSNPSAIRVNALAPPPFVTPICIILLAGILTVSQDWQTATTLSTTAITCVLLWSFERKGRLFKLFSSPWLVKIGLLSYSLYLWHWSVIVISRWTIGIFAWTIPFQLLAMIGLALISNRWIEQPLRRATWSSKKVKTMAYGLMATLSSALFLIALAGTLKGALYTGNSYPRAYTASFGITDTYEPCETADLGDRTQCFYPQKAADRAADSTADRTVYFVGDSHTGSLQSLASRLVEQKDVSRIMMVERDGCLFTSTLRRSDRDGDQCLASNRAVISEVSESGKPGDIVVVTNRYGLYFLAPNSRDDILKIEKGMFAYTYEGSPLSQAQALEKYSQNLTEIAQTLAKKDISLIVQAPLPDWKHLTHQCQVQWFRPQMAMPEDCELNTAIESEKRTPLLNSFRQLEAEIPNLHVYDPFPAFCDSAECSPFASDGTPLFRDADHLNDYGAEYLYTEFRAYLASESLIETQ